VVRVKNLFLATLDERAERFHLLPLMLTVAVDGELTFGELMQRPEARAAVDAYVAARDPTVPPHRWAETTTRARAMLETGALSAVRAQLLGEVQMVMSAHASVREGMHELYKAYRAESAVLLWQDFARTAAAEEGGGGGGGGGGVHVLAQVPESLWWAAFRGNRPAAEAFLKDRETSGVDVDEVVKGSAGRSTALFQASVRGHTDVGKVLVEAGANVDLGNPDDGATPLFIAAEKGHVDVVRVLVAAHANVDQAKTDDGATPLFTAARNGHVDVVRVLVAAHANVDQASTKGATPLSVAMRFRYHVIVEILRAADARVVQVHPFVGCDGHACGCTPALTMTGPRWHKAGVNFDLCGTAFDQLPEAEKLLFECIEYPGDQPVPYKL
jgi:hypothetical protein